MFFRTVDFHEDSDPSTSRTPWQCNAEFSKRRRPRGFGPFDAQNAILMHTCFFETSTSTRIRSLRRPERRSSAKSLYPTCRPQRGFGLFDVQNAILGQRRFSKGRCSRTCRIFDVQTSALMRIRCSCMTTSPPIRACGDQQRYSGDGALSCRCFFVVFRGARFFRSFFATY